MTEKLKTLKDFEGMQVHDDGTYCLLVVPLIKAEAIKWIKEYDLELDGDMCLFHNITSEDLK